MLTRTANLRRALACSLALGLLGSPLELQARETGEPIALASPRGRPDVSLDRLDFPQDVAGARRFEKRLRKILKREARRADWGAGSGAKISYRFAITQLSIEPQADVLRVRCTAVGRLPGGKSARSNLTFG